MQDRYAGDVGDFLKLGLLRALCSTGSYRLGINWYLSPNEFHNADGQHVSYLADGHRHGPSLRQCDPDLFARLRTLVNDGDRCVTALEVSGSLPDGAITYSEPLRRGLTQGERLTWHKQAVEKLKDAEVVFVDPDNGIRYGHPGSRSEKYALVDELRDYADRDQTLVIYQHADRSPGGVVAQAKRRLVEFRRATGARPIGAVIGRRGSCRFFLIVPTNRHRDRIHVQLDTFRAAWEPHVELVPFDP
jgi:hypothetical protein